MNGIKDKGYSEITIKVRTWRYVKNVFIISV